MYPNRPLRTPLTSMPFCVSSIVHPISSLNGLVVSSLVSVRLTARPAKKLNVGASYKFDDRDNRTAVHIYQYGDAGENPNANANFPAGPANPLGPVLARERDEGPAEVVDPARAGLQLVEVEVQEPERVALVPHVPPLARDQDARRSGVFVPFHAGMPGGGGAAAGGTFEWKTYPAPEELTMDYASFLAQTGQPRVDIPQAFLVSEDGKPAKHTKNEWHQLQFRKLKRPELQLLVNSQQHLRLFVTRRWQTGSRALDAATVILELEHERIICHQQFWVRQLDVGLHLDPVTVDGFAGKDAEIDRRFCFQRQYVFLYPAFNHGYRRGRAQHCVGFR